jgi:RND superfamily putative drug exporter
MFASPFFHAVGAAGVSVVTVAVLASLTLTPALLGTFAARIEPARESADGSGFARLAAAVRRRAGTTVAVIGLLLVVAGLPFAWVRLGVSGAELLPKTMESRQVYETVKARFPGGGRVPVQVVARADAPALRTWLEGQWGHPYLDVETKARQLAPGLSTADLYTVGTGKDEYAQDLVEDLRAHRPPFTTYVSGSAAGLVDFRAELGERLPRAALLVVGGTFVMMFLLTGSVLVPVKTLVMNILSLCAVFGALVLVFQQGVLSGPLGFTPTGNLESWMPVLVFAFAFGLSMDYEVFLLARIKEFHDLGHPSDEAVALGLQRSGRIITSAALIMVVVFSGFAAGHMLSVKQLGLALALAVAVDATLVRCLLVPATMTLLGRWNWWAPPPLRRLYDRYRLVS